MLEVILYFSLLGSFLALLFSFFIFIVNRRDIEKNIKKIYGQRERIEDKIYEWRDVMQLSPERFFDTNKLLLQNPETELEIKNTIPNFQFFTNLGIVIENIKVKENSVFCLMPFNDRYSAIYQAIFYSCQAAHYSCARSDDEFNPGNLLRQIVNMMLESSVIIALLDGQNPNVFYEIGIAHSIGKTVLLLAHKKNTNDIPFDLRSDRLLLYSNTSDLHNKLYETLKNLYYVDKGE